MPPSVEHPHHLLRYLPIMQQHPEHLVPEDGLQLFEFQGQRNAEHAIFTIKASICYENVGEIESEKIAKRLHGDDGAGDGIVFRNCMLEKNLEGFPGAAAQISKKLPIVEEVTAENIEDAED